MQDARTLAASIFDELIIELRTDTIFNTSLCSDTSLYNDFAVCGAPAKDIKTEILLFKAATNQPPITLCDCLIQDLTCNLKKSTFFTLINPVTYYFLTLDIASKTNFGPLIVTEPLPPRVQTMLFRFGQKPPGECPKKEMLGHQVLPSIELAPS